MAMIREIEMSGFGARNIQMDRRGERVFEAIVESGSLVVRQFGGDRAGEVGAHRFFEAPGVSFETIGDRFAARTRHAGPRGGALSSPRTPRRSISPAVTGAARGWGRPVTARRWVFSSIR